MGLSHEDGKPSDTRMDLLHANLHPHAHGLGHRGAQWRGAIIDQGEAEDEVRSDDAHEVGTNHCAYRHRPIAPSCRPSRAFRRFAPCVET